MLHTSRILAALSAGLFALLATAREAAAAKPQILLDIEESLGPETFDILVSIVLGILMFISGWIIAKFISWLLYRVLCKTDVDDRIAEKLGVTELLAGAQTSRKKNQLERTIARSIYWVLMLFVIIGVLQYSGLSEVASPLQNFLDRIATALPYVAKALLILGVFYILGFALSRLVSKALSGVGLDQRFAELTASDDGEKSAEDNESERRFSEVIGRAVFWLMILIGLAGAVDALHIQTLSAPLRGAFEKLIVLLPSVAIGVLIVVAGWFLGKIVRLAVDNSLDALGFNRVMEKAHLDQITGSYQPSEIAGMVAMGFVMLQALIAGLNQVNLPTLSDPLTAMMTEFWGYVPLFAGGIGIVLLGYLVGRALRPAVENFCVRVELDRKLVDLGLLSESNDDGPRAPRLVGIVVQWAVIALALVQGLRAAELHAWANYADMLVYYSATRVAVGALIVLVGLFIAAKVGDLIRSRSDDDLTRGTATIARYAIVIFAFTMAVHHLEVGPYFVIITFSLLFGGLCLAGALAFGLGGRDVASDIVRQQYNRARTAARERGDRGPGTAP